MKAKYLDYLFIVVAVLILSVSTLNNFMPDQKPWGNGFNGGFGCNTEDITNMYSDYVDTWRLKISKSFDKAVKEVLAVDPIPEVKKIDPDPKKCICGGSGTIVHGDGHKTKCPYHGKGQFGKDVIIKPLSKIKLEETWIQKSFSELPQ
jgi:hypothetical protein